VTAQFIATANLDTFPPLSGSSLLHFLVQLSLLLIAALLLGAAARRLGLPAIVGEICAGIVVGPLLLMLAPSVAHAILPGQPDQLHLLEAVGQIGVILLVGLSGIEINTVLFKRNRSSIAKISAFAALLPFGLGFVLGLMLPAQFVPAHISRLVFALFLATCMCVTALPVIARTLSDMKLIHSRLGQLTLASAMVDDMLGWSILALIPGLILAGHLSAYSIAKPVITLLLFIVVMFTIGRATIHWVLKTVQSSDESGVKVTALVILIITAAALSQALGLEAVFGAFLCGIIISSEGAYEKIPLPLVNSLLAPLFFALVGLRLNLPALFHPEILMIALLIISVAFAGKIAGGYLGSRLSGLQSWESWAIGAAMNSRGVVEIVIASVGLRLGVITPAIYTVIVLVAITTSIAAPPVVSLALKMAPAKSGSLKKAVAPLLES
jgi:Kef-type K+ transport system membrane component KefB